MCKHVAAVLYGIGARLDEQPELLFKLRKVDEKDLIAKAGKGLPLSKKGPAEDKVLAGAGLSELFGLDMGTSDDESAAEAMPARKKATRSRRVAKPRSKPADVAAPMGRSTRRSSTDTKKTPPRVKTKTKVKAKAKARKGVKKR